MECIHHIDGDPYNNDPANLMVVSVKNPRQMREVMDTPRLAQARERLEVAQKFWLSVRHTVPTDFDTTTGSLTDEEHARVISEAADRYRRMRTEYRRLVLV
jgi:hypothetical protein